MSDDVGFVCPHCTTKIKYTAGMTFGEVMSLRHNTEHLKHQIACLRADLAVVTAERNRMQHRLDAAYNVIDKDIKNDMAFAAKHANLWLENERLREALKETLAIARRNEAGDYVDRARAALEGVTEPNK